VCDRAEKTVLHFFVHSRRPRGKSIGSGHHRALLRCGSFVRPDAVPPSRSGSHRRHVRGLSWLAVAMRSIPARRFQATPRKAAHGIGPPAMHIVPPHGCVPWQALPRRCGVRLLSTAIASTSWCRLFFEALIQVLRPCRSQLVGLHADGSTAARRPMALRLTLRLQLDHSLGSLRGRFVTRGKYAWAIATIFLKTIIFTPVR
jgi:hypothetical protein